MVIWEDPMEEVASELRWKSGEHSGQKAAHEQRCGGGECEGTVGE